MLNELNALEGRITEVAALCRRLRTENEDLRKQLATSQTENRELVERMTVARSRLEQLAQQLPEAKV
ncbi:MAG TPA: hypothetical protein PLS67_11370 [Accumulibacter sp.]|jgi:cell division protein ZapB|nr:hypothetical protein [Accumulibacter sp.]HQC81096.1 hypothetical protein [Accumulibacter sp.]